MEAQKSKIKIKNKNEAKLTEKMIITRCNNKNNIKTSLPRIVQKLILPTNKSFPQNKKKSICP